MQTVTGARSEGNGSIGLAIGAFFSPHRKRNLFPNPPKKSSARAYFQNHSVVVAVKMVGVGLISSMGFFRYVVPQVGGQSKHSVINSSSVDPLHRARERSAANSSQ